MRVVLDTGVVISALLFREGRLAWLRSVWSTGTLTPVISRATVDELIRVLAYPTFQLTEQDIETVLAAYLPFCETARVSGRSATDLPVCDDPADQKFLELTSASRAQALVTGDHVLLALDPLVTFDIVSPTELRGRLEDR